MPDDGTPAGFVRVTAGRCEAVARAEHAEDARTMLAEGSLYEAAARDLSAVRLQGRAVAYAIALPVTGTQAVVRHNRHGGMLARLTRDLFLPPTRGPHELAVALRLQVLGVPTPDVLMYGTSPAPFPFRRADVVTRRILGGRDLATFMAFNSPSDEREAAWAATRELVRTMNETGVRHHDLNVKNVLIAPGEGKLAAHVLDVDRVTFGVPGSERVRRGNVERLLRSARKWRERHGALFDESDLADLLEPERAR
jgi:hypothetical protein